MVLERSAMATVRCPNCGKPIILPNTVSVEPIRCRNCRALVDLYAPPPEPAPAEDMSTLAAVEQKGLLLPDRPVYVPRWWHIGPIRFPRKLRQYAVLALFIAALASGLFFALRAAAPRFLDTFGQ